MQNSKESIIKKILLENKKRGIGGIPSICSANPYVIQAAMKVALEKNTFVLIESTCNQVNQYRGYSGMNPQEFCKYVLDFAKKMQLPIERVILGGDHLGPYPWRNLSVENAMNNAKDMVIDYAIAGYHKFHLDTSMHCADDDPSKPLSKAEIAERAVKLCQVIESTTANSLNMKAPVYVIGTEVPVPGGQQEKEECVNVTSITDVEETILVHKLAFQRAGLNDAWQRVIAVVVQPGVEFNEDGIIEYDQEKTKSLRSFIESVPELVYEAHSTDYQTAVNLKRLVENHFAILKVGPALTFAFREALIGLVHMEDFLFNTGMLESSSRLISVVNEIMEENPSEWEKYLPQNQYLGLARIFSYSDRIRYYWPVPRVQDSIATLIGNLRSVDPPLSIIKQYFQLQYWRIREGKLENEPVAIILDYIGDEVRKYANSCDL